jgi:hypothetical protein
MRKFILLVLLIILTGCIKKEVSTAPKVKLLKEIVVNHSKTDSAYRYYGIYKEIYRVYNRTYKDSTLHSYRMIDINYGVDLYVNEYGDTITEIYTDYTSYPRRED